MKENTANERNFKIGLKVSASRSPEEQHYASPVHPLRCFDGRVRCSPVSRRRGVSADTPDHDDQIAEGGVAALGR